MKDQRLLASIALFRELYDSNKDIYHLMFKFLSLEKQPENG